MPRTFRFVAAGALACIAGPVLAQPVTSVVTHGQQTGGKSAWLEGMADAIIARAGSGAVLRYREIDGAWQLVSGVLDENEPVALIFRWIDDQAKAGTDRGYAEGAGDALYAALRDPRFADAGGAPLPAFPLVEGRFLHLLGHSRGPIVNSEAVRRFGAAGVTVDHVTTMDPHPVDGTLDPPLFDEDWGDPMPQRWSNVTFADNYWRADGGGFINGFDFDGIPIPFTLDVELSESALNCCAYPLAHSDVHLWYHGTIDTGPTANDGDQAITTTMRNTWWPEGFTERGFYYARLGGGVDERPALPAGVDPGEVSLLYRGGFDDGSFAGWLYQGGGGGGSLVNEGGDWVMQLGATGAGAVDAHRHNRHWIPGRASVTLDLRVVAASGGADQLEVNLIDRDGATHVVAAIALDAPGGESAIGPLVIPASVPTPGTFRLELGVRAGGAGTATVRLDDVTIEALPPCPGDIAPPTGLVDVEDVLAVINAWGPCPALPTPCPADLAPPALVVDTDDLLAVINGWGTCPAP